MGLFAGILKPENFLLLNEDENSPLKTSDFGLSNFYKPGDVFKDIMSDAYYYILFEDMEKEIRKEVDDSIAKAKDCPMPDPSELFTNVYVKGFGTEPFGADRKEVKAALP